MRINLRNNAKLTNKNIRFLKWKLYSIKDKFQNLIYADVHINTEGQSPRVYSSNVKLGIPGHDIVLHNKSKSVNELLKKTVKDINRYLAKNKKTKVMAKKAFTARLINAA